MQLPPSREALLTPRFILILENVSVNVAPAAQKTAPPLEMPKGACDTHCHVFGPSARFPYAANRRYEPEESPLPILAAIHQRLGIERAVIIQASAYGTDNAAMLDAISTAPAKYRGVAMIDDDTPDRELERMDAAGVKGIRFNFVQSLGGYPDPGVFARAVARAQHFGWHVVLHMKGEDIVRLEETIGSLPGQFVIDHMARLEVALGLDQLALQILLELLAEEGAWVKISGAERMCGFPFDDAVPYAQAIVAARPERVLWGTDFPHPNLPFTVREEDLINLLHRIVPDPFARRRILVDNPARLYGFPPSGLES